MKIINNYKEIWKGIRILERYIYLGVEDRVVNIL